MKSMGNTNLKPFKHIENFNSIKNFSPITSQRKNEPVFKSYFYIKPKSLTSKNSVVDTITEKILKTFFNYKTPSQQKLFKEEVKRFQKIQKQINKELKTGTKLNEIY